MFEGFDERRVPTPAGEIYLRSGGSGPPLLLIHGYPQTHAIWHRVAPALAQRHRVVVPDSLGYGRSAKPPGGENGAAYAKREVARELVGVMAELGHESFAVAGHDRGGRVAYRMALDHPERVTRLVALDIVPTLDTWEQMGFAGGLFAYHWYFLAQPPPFPESLIAANAEYFLLHTLRSWAGDPDCFGEAALRDYLECFAGETIRASCDDYRAGATVDRELDARDREAGRRIDCPVLALWGDHSGTRPSLLDTWKRWADDVRGRAIACGHFLPEEAPDEVAAEMREFLGA
ncbi:MAG: alpha/beta hydrolase [Proteobacteria bacterium]|nr:alpha/beta hydrolase [Pseudomonadota bacterium]